MWAARLSRATTVWPSQSPHATHPDFQIPKQDKTKFWQLTINSDVKPGDSKQVVWTFIVVEYTFYSSFQTTIEEDRKQRANFKLNST